MHRPPLATRFGLVVGCLLLATARATADDPASLEFFEKNVRPVLVEHCYRCHSSEAKKPKGGLLLDSRLGLLKGGDSGPALVPGQPEQSHIIEAVGYQSVDLRMPPRGKLRPQAIADLTLWVKAGAPWPAEPTPQRTATAGVFDLQQRKQEHWAWQPIRAQGPPAVKTLSWPRQPVDSFILARLEGKGLAPAPPADRRTLLRRATFDLIGLPPTPAEMEAFLLDDSREAFEKVVDRLLASPHFGERWGRHWLDLVRYAETHGHEFDYPIPNAHQYRDYVVRAFNADVPYNQFVVEHLAGDLLSRPRLHSVEGFNESILGTGFWLLNEAVHSPVDIRQDEADRFDNRIDVMTKTFLGLTVACARCHDHKFDAISAKDYYALFGFLESSSYRQERFDDLPRNEEIAGQLVKLRERVRPAVQRELVARLRPAVEQTARYLLAAREALASGGTEEIARAHGLDAKLLDRWVACLRSASGDASSPLRAWAVTAGDSGTDAPRHLAGLLAASAEATQPPLGTEIVLDYGKASPADWMPDGLLFGHAPVRPGDVRFSGDPVRPILQVFDRAAATTDRAWDGLRPAPRSENDTGGLGGMTRAGRTIRTPTFTLTRGKVFYLVRGVGRAYAAVGQHTLINGPLHGQLILPIKAGDPFQWIAHDLTAYQGQQAHIEFSAAEGSDFAVAMVTQAEQVPNAGTRPDSLWRQLAEGGDCTSLEALAGAYQRLFLDVLDRLASDRIRGSDQAAAYARLADWLVRRPELFSTEDQPVEAARAFLAEQAKLLARIKPESRLAPALLDGTGVDEHVFIRGSPKAPGELAPRRFLEALAGPERLDVAHGSGRLELAQQMTDPALNPFIARVIVNRVWHHVFGRGIVASVDNFGVMGEAPTHPELLDYLAEQFVRDGWSIKRLIRTLVLSSSYRMSSQPDAQADAVDPQNLLLHRMRLRRLEGEAIRDAMLAISGRLDDRMYGVSVPVYLTDFQDGRGKPASGPLDGDGRRSVYLSVRRNFLAPFLLAFDTPAPASTVGRRTVSNVPAQALILMNDPFVHQQAEAWAKRVLAGGGGSRERICGMYQSAFGREPAGSELEACVEFLGGRSDETAWQDLAHVLFNAKEFIFVN